MKYRFVLTVETQADIIPTSIAPGSYPDPNWVDAMFATVIAPYEADPTRRVLSFEIKRAPELQ